MQAKLLNAEPVAVTTAASNMLNCAITSLAGPVGYTQTQPFINLQQIRALNTLTTTSINLTVYKGASGGSAQGTQFGFPGVQIPANSYLDFFTKTRLDSVDYITAIGSLPGIVLNFAGEISLS